MLGLLLNHDLAEPSRGLPRDMAISCGPASYDGSDWAWEFLRRNPDYGADWRGSVPRRLPHVTLKDGTRLLRLRRRFPRAERWGLYAFADPSVAARQAPVFWHMAALKQVVRVRAAPPTHRENLTPLTLSSFNVDRAAAPEMLRIQGSGTEFTMQPGTWRSNSDHDVAVGRHQPPSSDRVEAFMTYFAERYRFERLGKAARITAIPAAHHRFN